jgi:hypothetical protein
MLIFKILIFLVVLFFNFDLYAQDTDEIYGLAPIAEKNSVEEDGDVDITELKDLMLVALFEDRIEILKTISSLL